MKCSNSSINARGGSRQIIVIVLWIYYSMNFFGPPFLSPLGWFRPSIFYWIFVPSWTVTSSENICSRSWGAQEKGKTGWNLVYHQNWWFSEFHPPLNVNVLFHHQSHSENNHWVLEPDWKSGLKLDLVSELELNPDLILELKPKQEIKT
jgi:hypothetical protein